MEDMVKKIIKRYYGRSPRDISTLGGGFYAKVYLAQLETEPYNLVIKVYSSEGLVYREKQQLEMLRKHSLIYVPKIYLTHNKDTSIRHDVLVMEYVEGVNAGVQSDLLGKDARTISNRIVDNLIHLHSISNEDGFGQLDALDLAKDWRDLYKQKALIDYAKGEKLRDVERLDGSILNIMKKAIINFEDIFYKPITRPSLIHGDYNIWNILLNKERNNVIALIDPYNCCWGDPEFDLYQLNNANGKSLGLLDEYIKKKDVSENFYMKLAFYELFTEVMHYYDANVKPSEEHLKKLSAELNQQLEGRY